MNNIEEIIRNAKLRQKEPTLEYSSGLISAYSAFKSKIYDPKSVLYPSCGTDASPSRVFENVTFVDLNENSISALKNKGFKAITSDIRNYVPTEEHDLLILMNPAIDPSWATKHLILGGYILANDYHGSATWLAKRQTDFSLIGSTNEKENTEISLDTTGLFESVSSLEELKILDPKRYDFIVKSALHQLSFGGKVDKTKTLEENYFLFCDTMHMERNLPFKRKADLYIFRKNN